MYVSRIEPGDEPNHGMQTFHCLTCMYTETVSTKFRQVGKNGPHFSQDRHRYS